MNLALIRHSVLREKKFSQDLLGLKWKGLGHSILKKYVDHNINQKVCLGKKSYFASMSILLGAHYFFQNMRSTYLQYIRTLQNIDYAIIFKLCNYTNLLLIRVGHFYSLILQGVAVRGSLDQDRSGKHFHAKKDESSIFCSLLFFVSKFNNFLLCLYGRGSATAISFVLNTHCCSIQ